MNNEISKTNRTRVIGFRVTDAERETVAKAAATLGLSASEFLRALCERHIRRTRRQPEGRVG